MLGGSVFMAFLRFAISLAGTVLLFSLMSESRFHTKKTVICYGCFGLVLVLAACVWYVADWENCVRMVAFVMFICFAVFAIWISSDPIFLSMYKLAFTFYLLAVFLIGGIEISVLFFHRNLWADRCACDSDPADGAYDQKICEKFHAGIQPVCGTGAGSF